jgi:YbbR domain-containing protein
MNNSEKWVIRLLMLICFLILIISIRNSNIKNKQYDREHSLNKLRDSVYTANFVRESKKLDSLIINNNKQDSLLKLKSNNSKVIINNYTQRYEILSDSIPFLPNF